MSRWIRQEDATATIGNMYERCDNDIVDYRELLLQCVEDLYGVEIVTCGECKHWDDRRKDAWWSEEGACYLTSRLGDATYRNHDDFCSYGERKDDDDQFNSEINSNFMRSNVVNR